MPGPDPNAPPTDPASRAWMTLITRSTYLPGVVILIHTLHKHKTIHALIVQYTSSLSEDCITCLQTLTKLYPLLRTQQISPLPLPPGLKTIASRFDDTLTKLRAFQPLDDPNNPTYPPLTQVPKEICFLDADIAIFRNLDDIFTIPRPDANWIAAHHSCICNHDSDPWAPKEWNPANCPNSHSSHPEALEAPMPSSSKDGAPPTNQLLNSGVFVCTPSSSLWERMELFRLTSPLVEKFQFPDQNFLDEFFRDHWVPIGWQYNALKTHRYWHANAWRDGEVRAVHYIVDKPWEARVGEDGMAGYKGRDGVTHSWWWGEYDGWEKEMEGWGKEGKEVLGCVGKYVCVDSGLGKTNFEE